MSMIFSLGQTAFELGLICSLTVLALFLSYSMLNVCDLSTDGCFTLGCAVCAMVTLAGHPVLGLLAATAAGICSGSGSLILSEFLKSYIIFKREKFSMKIIYRLAKTHRRSFSISVFPPVLRGNIF